jgi:hypothetical protein
MRWFQERSTLSKQFGTFVHAGGSLLRVKHRLRRIAPYTLALATPDDDDCHLVDLFRTTPIGGRTPVILWTGNNLSHDGAKRLQGPIQRAVLKGSNGDAPTPEALRNLLGRDSHGDRTPTSNSRIWRALGLRARGAA